jgi:hypothetical protein
MVAARSNDEAFARVAGKLVNVAVNMPCRLVRRIRNAELDQTVVARASLHG